MEKCIESVWNIFQQAFFDGGSNPSESSVATSVFFQSGKKLGSVEIWPEGGGNDEFGVGDLPKQVVAEAHFAAGSDKEVGVRNVSGVEMPGDHWLVNLFG